MDSVSNNNFNMDDKEAEDMIQPLINNMVENMKLNGVTDIDEQILHCFNSLLLIGLDGYGEK